MHRVRYLGRPPRRTPSPSPEPHGRRAHHHRAAGRQCRGSLALSLCVPPHLFALCELSRLLFLFAVSHLLSRRVRQQFRERAHSVHSYGTHIALESLELILLRIYSGVHTCMIIWRGRACRRPARTRRVCRSQRFARRPRLWPSPSPRRERV